jgi:soluble lytic murein transglycosylase-like protein
MFPGARSASKFELTAGHVQRLQPLFPIMLKEGERTRLSAYLLAGIAWGESDFIPTAKNTSSGAAGLMQVMPGHFSRLGWSGQDWANPTKNIRAGADILADQLRARKTIPKALAGYGGFVSWAKDPKSVDPGGPKDATWYIDEAIGRAWVIELEHRFGTIKLPVS